MCGIAGFVSLGNPYVGSGIALRAMSSLIAHRGPDGEGEWSSADSRVGLVHRRLAIIDLSESGAQPMRAPNGTVITYNGEIYNYIELREELSAHWTFRSSSDTEVILAAYEQMGRGMRYPSARHVRLRDLGRAKPQTVRCARSLRHQAILSYEQEGGLFFASEAKGACCRSCRISRPTRPRSQNI